MSWDWADSADERVVDLWHQRTELSVSRRVVYTKWYQGRATFFSRPMFSATLRLLDSARRMKTLASESAEIYRLLLDDSPQTTRMIRDALSLDSPRGLTELWRRLLVVGYGELDEGSYPSLQMGATRLLFEDLWEEAEALGLEEAEALVKAKLAAASPFAKQLARLRNKARREPQAPGHVPTRH